MGRNGGNIWRHSDFCGQILHKLIKRGSTLILWFHFHVSAKSANPSTTTLLQPPSRTHSNGRKQLLCLSGGGGGEPTPKIPKLDHHQNGVVAGSSSYFKVKKLSEKAVLPSRGSPLSAGYDLSRSVF